MMEGQKRRVGRPRKNPDEPMGHSYSSRMRASTRDKVLALANENGWSFSQQVEWIIERHFDRASIFDEIAARLRQPVDNL
jgi:hypothetical protein